MTTDTVAGPLTDKAQTTAMSDINSTYHEIKPFHCRFEMLSTETTK